MKLIKSILAILLICTLFAACGTSEGADTRNAAVSAAREPAVTEASEFMKTAESTKTPEPTRTLEPTKTLELTETPEPEKAAEPAKTPEPTETAVPTATPEPAVTETPEPTATPEPAVTETREPTEELEPTKTLEPEPQIDNISNNQEGHFTFNPHVFGSRYLEQFGEEMRDTFFAFCDALRNGEDSFACPDQNSFGWCTGRLGTFFFPVCRPYVEQGSWEDGVATISYLIPKEEFLQKEKEFEKAIVAILNDALSDDYTDFEKILALYEYVTTHYEYDNEMFEHTQEWMDDQSAYRCLTEKKGICVEIAGLYNYLLLQVGIDSEEMSGVQLLFEDMPESHSWVFVNLDGESYHIDPTYALTNDRPPLDYFMMNDEIREIRDSLPKENYSIAAMGDESRDFFEFEATSSKYLPLWIGRYIGMDRARRMIAYEDYDGELMWFEY